MASENLDKLFHIILIGCISWMTSYLVAWLSLCNGWIFFLLVWLFGSLITMVIAAQTIKPDKKAVLITGCDKGFGHSLALRLDILGFRVFACCLFADKGEGAATLRENGSEKLHVIQMNVTSEEEIKAARKKIESLTPEDECLWAIVNNAGIATIGCIEWCSLSSYKSLMEVNVYGAISVTKTFLPLVKKAKGRVINVTSMLGRMSAPLRSQYVASKHALQGISEGLRLEMKRFNVDVITMEPGNYIRATRIMDAEMVAKLGEEMWQEMPEETRLSYGEEGYRAIIDRLINLWTDKGTDFFSPVIRSFEEAITQKYPQVRYQPANFRTRLRVLAAAHLPDFILDYFFTWI